jgi:hypothetical protein
VQPFCFISWVNNFCYTEAKRGFSATQQQKQHVSAREAGGWEIKPPEILSTVQIKKAMVAITFSCLI